MSSEHLTEPVVIDALPKTSPQASQSAPGQHIDPRAFAGSAAEQISSLGHLLNPLASTFTARLGKGIGQVRQWSQEKLGTAEDVTELPQEYKELEKRVDALRNVHQTLLRITRVYSTSSYDYPTNYQETVLDLGKSAATTFQGLQSLAISPAERAEAEAAAASKPAEQQAPRTLPHAIARAALAGSEQLGLEDPLGQALFKYATIQEKVGDARVKSDAEINTKFVQPFQTTLKTNIEFAMRARRNVQSSRLTLDSCKARYRAARPERSEAARLEVEQAEDQFVATVEEATTLMKSVLETPEPLRNLADLVTAQLTFHKEAAAILADLAPEIDEMQVTQEALYRNLRNE